MRQHEDCWLCAKKVPDPKEPCTNCGGKRTVPLVPDVGTMVVYRRPLNSYEKELIEKGDETEESLVVSGLPLMVVRADRVGSHGKQVVRVKGWLYLPGDTLDTKDPAKLRSWMEGTIKHDPGKLIHVPGVGLILPVNETPKTRWLDRVNGPSNKPGCWRWRKT